MNADSKPSRILRRRPAQLAAALAITAGLSLAGAQPAAAQQLVLVPPGCGSLSGTMVAVNTLDDHSGDPGPLGTQAVPHQVAANNGMITVGTQFGDFIQGNAVNETICGLGGVDTLKGGSGDDDIFGGNDGDIMWGEANADLLSGGEQIDSIFGDDPGNTHGGFDGVDTIQGGNGNDTLRGGASNDIVKGGQGTDFGDGQGGTDSCTGVETGPALNPGAGQC
jgi:Ca2+-binding RTX toxin-like protein